MLSFYDLKTLRKYLPSEFSSHEGTIAMLPYRTDIWRDNAMHAQRLVLEIVDIISRHEKVYLCVYKEKIAIDLPQFNANVVVIDVPYDDIWARDISPLFLIANEQLTGANFQFNAWGGKEEGSYYPWDNDANFADNICDFLSVDSLLIDFVVEGGALAHNGVKLIITTESVLLNKNRNPFATKKDFEVVFHDYFGIEKVIWLNRGFFFDETDGHVDVFLNFIDEHNLFLAWTDDRNNPQYNVLHEAYLKLSNETAVDGKPLNVHKLLMPSPMEISECEAAGIVQHQNAIKRTPAMKLYPTYNNAYIFNDGVLVPTFNCPEDDCAVNLYRKHFPGRTIFPLYSKEILIGGGNYHCILHEIPRRFLR